MITKGGEAEKGRKKFKKGEDRKAGGFGDCIDCFQCVNVCPTGIDIRNGTQLECVNCTACIDECDTIMENVNLPKGLIRFASEDNIVQKEKFRFTSRMKGYAAVCFILTGILTGLLFLRNDVQANILRLPGQLYETTLDNQISNVYTFKIINKTTSEIAGIEFKLVSHKGKVAPVGHKDFTIPAQGLSEGTLFIELHPAALEDEKEELEIGIYSNNKLIETTTTTFMGPRSYN